MKVTVFLNYIYMK